MKEVKANLPNSHLDRLPVVAECTGCEKIFVKEDSSQVCICYWKPAAMQRYNSIGRPCIMQTNLEVVKEEKKKVNPLKASKRALGKK